MGSRLTALRVPRLDGPVKGEDLASFARFLRECPLLDGRIASVTFAASSAADLIHGLDRPYRGCIELGRTSGFVNIVAREVGNAAAAGLDVSTFIRLTASGATGATVTFWVF